MAKKKPTEQTAKRLQPVAASGSVAILTEVRQLIQLARDFTATTVNSSLVMLYWQIGQRIRTELLQSKRASYGEEICSTLSNDLHGEFGNGFSRPNLTRMIRFAEAFPDQHIVSTLSRQLGWSHFVEIIYLKTDLERDFYSEMCRIERWSVRTLREKMKGMLFERTALSTKPKKLAEKELATLRASDQLSPDLVFRDPYFLDFLGLKSEYSEKDLEAAILREMESFILELGIGFTFVARQKRIIIDGKDFYLDLLFYHRKLRRLVAIELKLGAFQAADKGQIELYLRWLEKHEMVSGEEPPIGLILCAEKGEEQIELLQLNAGGIRVASYLTELPSKSVLQKKLRITTDLARERLSEQTSRRSNK